MYQSMKSRRINNNNEIRIKCINQWNQEKRIIIIVNNDQKYQSTKSRRMKNNNE